MYHQHKQQTSTCQLCGSGFEGSETDTLLIIKHQRWDGDKIHKNLKRNTTTLIAHLLNHHPT